MKNRSKETLWPRGVVVKEAGKQSFDCHFEAYYLGAFMSWDACPKLRQTISFVEISIEAGILLGGRHEACFVLGVAGIEPMPS